ncbi:MAG TPA: Smr/MutS family protein [Gammaproteobacteria bacterium]|nr:Smr/MutS family protein [Gammaproteobacteria bacterium]
MAQRFKLEENDKRLFRDAVADASPLPAAPLRRGPKPRPRARFTRANEREILEASLAGLPDPDEPLIGEGLWYAKPGVQDATLRKLRRGHYSIGAELDLHGLRSEDARRALIEFLHSVQTRRVRCVRIIHGKGYRSGPRGPVLKQKLNGWLRQRAEVIAFCSARPADGGTGAVYVLLGAG